MCPACACPTPASADGENGLWQQAVLPVLALLLASVHPPSLFSSSYFITTVVEDIVKAT